MATIDEDAALDRMLDTLERWLASEVVPNVLDLEHADEYPRAMVEQMREFGLFGIVRRCLLHISFDRLTMKRYLGANGAIAR